MLPRQKLIRRPKEKLKQEISKVATGFVYSSLTTAYLFDAKPHELLSIVARGTQNKSSSYHLSYFATTVLQAIVENGTFISGKNPDYFYTLN